MKEGEANGAIKSYVVRCERTGQYRAVLAANPREACEILDAEDGLWDERREFVTTPAEDAHALYCVYAPHGWVASRENVDAMSRARIVQRSTYVGSFALTRASQERERDRLLALQSQAWRERHGETIPGHEGEDDWTARLAVFAGPEGFADDWGEEYLNEPFLEPFDDEMLQVQGRPLQALHAHEDSTAHPPDAPDPDPLTLLDPAAARRTRGAAQRACRRRSGPGRGLARPVGDPGRAATGDRRSDRGRARGRAARTRHLRARRGTLTRRRRTRRDQAKPGAAPESVLVKRDQEVERSRAALPEHVRTLPPHPGRGHSLDVDVDERVSLDQASGVHARAVHRVQRLAHPVPVGLEAPLRLEQAFESGGSAVAGVQDRVRRERDRVGLRAAHVRVEAIARFPEALRRDAQATRCAVSATGREHPFADEKLDRAAQVEVPRRASTPGEEPRLRPRADDRGGTPQVTRQTPGEEPRNARRARGLVHEEERAPALLDEDPGEKRGVEIAHVRAAPHVEPVQTRRETCGALGRGGQTLGRQGALAHARARVQPRGDLPPVARRVAQARRMRGGLVQGLHRGGSASGPRVLQRAAHEQPVERIGEVHHVRHGGESREHQGVDRERAPGRTGRARQASREVPRERSGAPRVVRRVVLLEHGVEHRRVTRTHTERRTVVVHHEDRNPVGTRERVEDGTGGGPAVAHHEGGGSGLRHRFEHAHVRSEALAIAIRGERREDPSTRSLDRTRERGSGARPVHVVVEQERERTGAKVRGDEPVGGVESRGRTRRPVRIREQPPFEGLHLGRSESPLGERARKRVGDAERVGDLGAASGLVRGRTPGTLRAQLNATRERKLVERHGRLLPRGGGDGRRYHKGVEETSAEANVNKRELTVRVANAADLTQREATRAVDAVFQEIGHALMEENAKVRIAGFGTFEVRNYAPRAVTNRNTGVTHHTPARVRVQLKGGGAAAARRGGEGRLSAAGASSRRRKSSKGSKRSPGRHSPRPASRAARDA